MTARAELESARWVPEPRPDWQGGIVGLASLLRGRRLALLSGAGLSTASGIPDYRGEGTRRRATNPIAYRKFVQSDLGRRRYWSRAMLGWKRIEAAEPNEAHWAVSLLERSGLVGGIVTQNVDGLHQKAGSENVTELHGNLREILCLDCGERTPRWELQKRLEEANPRWASRPFELGPDGNAEADDGELEEFQVMDCLRCGGLLKPNVVFFGEGVERAKVQEATEIVARSEALLVVGSSLAVFSGYRFVRQAHKAGLAIAVINIGETRADPVASAKLEGRVSDVLPLLAKHLMSNA